MTTLLERLVAINTENPPGREVEAADLLRSELAGNGFNVTLDEFATGRANVSLRIENGPGPAFAFNSHIDVVPAGDGWTQDPLKLTERGGRLHGRGSCDAKGCIAAMVEAIRMLDHSRGGWSGTLLGLFVADEEIGSIGAKAYVSRHPKIDYVIVGEPTSNATVSAHKGSIRAKVRVLGETAHSASPHLGENAIVKAGRLLGLVEKHGADLAALNHPLLGKPTMTVTRIGGGHADNVVPDSCELLIERRMLPGETEDAIKSEFAGLLARAFADSGVRAEITGYGAITPPAETAAGHPIVRACLSAGARHGAAKDDLRGFQGGCDLVHFRSVGTEGAVLGPGSIEVAHKPDEYVPVDEFVNASRIYRDVALEMLSGRGPR